MVGTRVYRPTSQHNFDYSSSSNPTTSTNPITLFTTFVNISTGEIFVCTDNTPGSNVWVGQTGTSVS